MILILKAFFIFSWLWVFNILVWLDKGANVILSPLLNAIMSPQYKFGDHRDTLSEVFGRNRETCKICYFICRALHWFEKNHCKKSIED